MRMSRLHTHGVGRVTCLLLKACLSGCRPEGTVLSAAGWPARAVCWLANSCAGEQDVELLLGEFHRVGSSEGSVRVWVESEHGGSHGGIHLWQGEYASTQPVVGCDQDVVAPALDSGIAGVDGR